MKKNPELQIGKKHEHELDAIIEEAMLDERKRNWRGVLREYTS